jgi:hypothetical protein
MPPKAQWIVFVATMLAVAAALPVADEVRYVRVSHRSTAIEMREVVVMSAGVNVALGMSASQSGFAGATMPSVCVDGVTEISAGSGAGYCATGGTLTEEYWQVDLGATPVAVDAVFIYNRVGYLSAVSNLAGAAVQLITADQKRSAVSIATADGVQAHFERDPHQTCGVRTIRIELPGTPTGGGGPKLQMREVFAVHAGVPLTLFTPTLSDTDGGNYASRCVDTNWRTDESFGTAYCGTKDDPNNWFEARLATGQPCVDTVTIVNRYDDATHSLAGASVLWLSPTGLPVRVFTATDAVVQQFTLPAEPPVTAARDVRIVHNLASLSMREVAVYSNGTNVAGLASSSATMSTPTGGGIAAHCNDGVRNGTDRCECTPNQDMYWAVKFGVDFAVDSVAIWNRAGNSAQQAVLAGAVAVVTDKFHTPLRVFALTGARFQLHRWAAAYATPAIGFVRVEKSGERLNMREVAAVAGAANVLLHSARATITEDPSANTARSAAHCVDGFRQSVATFMGCESSAFGADDHHFEVDVRDGAASPRVEQVVVFNRHDANDGYLVGAVAVLLTPAGEPVAAATLTSGSVQVLRPGGAAAVMTRFVRIEQRFATLSFAEVQVFSGGVNVARDKPSEMRVAPSGSAANANDGDWATTAQSFTSSVYEWYEIDLVADHCVDAVLLGAATGVLGASVQLVTSDRVVTRAFTASPKPYQFFPANYTARRAAVRYVRVVASDADIGLREVRVMMAGVNVALAGAATLSSAAPGGGSPTAVAARCVDDDTGNANLCATTSETQAWVQIDLGSELCIDSVVLFNRRDVTPPTGLKHAAVFAYSEAMEPVMAWATADAPLQELAMPAGTCGAAAAMQCQPSGAPPEPPAGDVRYVRVSALNTYTQMRQVMVVANGTNVALSKQTRASDVWNNHYASFCVDGHTEIVAEVSCITNSGANRWWEVDLGRGYAVDAVVVYNRQDSEPQRLLYASVTLLDATRAPVNVFAATAQSVQLFQHSPAPTHCGVRYVRVENAYSEPINLREVVVVSGGANIARGKATRASSAEPSYDDATSNVCNDGVTAAAAATTTGVCMTYAKVTGEWWEVDLGAEHCVDSIVVYNRLRESTGDWAHQTKANTSTLLTLSARRAPTRVFHLTADVVQAFDVNPRPPNHPVAAVRVEHVYERIAFREVEAWSGGANVAVGQSATQSSAASASEGATKAVDGYRGPPSKTNADRSEWFEVALSASVAVDSVMAHVPQSKAAAMEGAVLLLLTSTGVPIRVFRFGSDVIRVFRAEPWLPSTTPAVDVRIEKHTGVTKETLQVEEIVVVEGAVNVARDQAVAVTPLPGGLNGVSGGARCTDGSVRSFGSFMGCMATTASVSHRMIQFNVSSAVPDQVIVFNRRDTLLAVPQAPLLAGATLLLLSAAAEPLAAFTLTSEFQQAFALSPRELPLLRTRYIRVEQHSGFIAIGELYAYADGVNVAQGKAARHQASATGSATANMAVDGDAATWSSTMLSSGGIDLWWEVDLGAEHCLSSVVVHQPEDAGFDILQHHDAMDGAKLIWQTGGRVPTRTFTLTGDRIQQFQGNSTGHVAKRAAKYVRVGFASQLVLREIVVMSGGVNIAVGAPVRMSSAGSGGTAGSDCTDNSTVTTCETGTGAFQSVRVDFSPAVCIDSVVIFTRLDQAPDVAMVQVISADNELLRVWPMGTTGTVHRFDLGPGACSTAPLQCAAPPAPPPPAAGAVRYVRVSAGYRNNLHMREVVVVSNGANVALNKPASMSSQKELLGKYSASVCNDGDAVEMDLNGTVCYTNAGDDEWWEVDLGSPVAVDAVVVYNRLSAGSSQLEGAVVTLLSAERAPLHVAAPLSPAIVQLVRTPAAPAPHCGVRYVRVEQQADKLNMREVVVFSGGTNVAFGKPARQSSLSVAGVAKDAGVCTDGFTTVSAAKLCKTNDGTGNFWEVDLGAEHCVDHVAVYNRQDESVTRLAGAVLVVQNSARVPLRVFPLTQALVQVYQLNPAPPNFAARRLHVYGRYMHMQLREVQLWAGGVNVALAGAATQSTTYTYLGLRRASYANDGRTAEVTGGGESSVTDNNNDAEWWEVELAAPAVIDSVVVYNQAWNTPDRLRNAVAVLYTDGGLPLRAFTLTAALVQMYRVDPRSPRYPLATEEVRLEKEGNGALSLTKLDAYAGARGCVSLGQPATLSGNTAADAERCVTGPASSPCTSTLVGGFNQLYTINVSSQQAAVQQLVVANDMTGSQETRLAAVSALLLGRNREPSAAFTLDTTYEQLLLAPGAELAAFTTTSVHIVGSKQSLRVAELQVWAEGVNVAAGRPVVLSSMVTGKDGSFATDGIDFPATTGDFAGTLSGEIEYVSVDLGGTFCVSSVVVVQPLLNYDTIAGAHLALTGELGRTRTFTLTGANIQQHHHAGAAGPPRLAARFVRVRHNGGQIAMREVFVLSGGVNIAVGKTATQSSLGGGSGAANCVDNSTTTTCVTTTENDCWWLLDFGGDVCVDSIVIYNAVHVNPLGLAKAAVILLSANGQPLRVFEATADTVQRFVVGDGACVAEAPNCTVATGTATASRSRTELSSRTASEASSATASASGTAPASGTASGTATPTHSVTPGGTASRTATAAHTRTRTATTTASGGASGTASVAAARTASASATESSTVAVPPTPSASSSVSKSASRTRSGDGGTASAVATLTLLPPVVAIAVVVPPAEVAAATAAAVMTSTIGAVSNPAAAMQVSRALSVLALAECRGDHTVPMAFPLSLVPPFGFGAATAHYARGAVVANLLGVPVFAGVALLVGAALVAVSKTPVEPNTRLLRIQRAARFPGCIAIAFAFVVGGMSIGGAAAAAHGGTPGLDLPLLLVVVGAVAAAVVLITRRIRHATDHDVAFQPCRLEYITRPAGRETAAVFTDVTALKARVLTFFLFGGFAWVPVGAACAGGDVPDRFGILWTRYRGGGEGLARVARYFFVVEVVITVLVAGVSGLIPWRCDVVANLLVVLSFAAFALSLAVRPYIVGAKNVLTVACDGFTFVGTLLIAIAVQVGDAELARSGSRAVLAGMYLGVASSFLSVSRFVLLRVWRCRMQMCLASGAVPLLHLLAADIGGSDAGDADNLRGGDDVASFHSNDGDVVLAVAPAAVPPAPIAVPMGDPMTLADAEAAIDDMLQLGDDDAAAAENADAEVYGFLDAFEDDVANADAEVDAMLAEGEDDPVLDDVLGSSLDLLMGDVLPAASAAPGPAPVVYTGEGIRLKRELEEALARRELL